LWLVNLVPIALAWLVAVRAPGSPVAAPLAWTGAATIAVPVLENWALTDATAAPWPGSGVAAVVGPEGLWPWQLVPFAWLLLVFPDGVLPGRRWRVAAGAVPVAAVLIGLAMAWAGPGDDAGAGPAVLLAAGFALLLTGLVGCVGSLVVRHRRGDERTRLQLRWLTLAAGCVPVLLVTGWVMETLGASLEASYAGFLLAMLVLVPAAVTVAIVRYDLFDVDRLLGESLAWLLTTATAAGLFAGVVLLTGQLVGERVGVTGAAFVTALCLLPVHRQLQELVGRMVDPDRTVRLAAVRRFAERVRDGQAEPEEVEQVLRDALDDPAARLLLHAPGESGGHVDLRGEPAAPEPGAPQVPLRTAAAEVGVLVLGAGSARRLRRAREAALAARLPIEVSRLRLALRRALADVRASRSRLVAAGAEERRRLERDLHDGAQQQVVAVAMRLQAVQRQLGPHHPAYPELAGAVQSLEGTLAELRRLAHGVRPSRLDDGLGPALAHLVRDCAVPVELSVEDVALSDLAATTAYFVVAESVANALKHAGAGRVRVEVRAGAGQLHLTVADDGGGGARDGFGLTSLRDRVASAGGRVAVTSPAGGGTTVAAVIPCGS
ncbi:MAG TPA: histidine kinase, partial [Mycobacteriales bacterium]|nr:histidine kinase [Mycobacteriales bacterium]